MKEYYVLIHNNSADKIDWARLQGDNKVYFIITDFKSHKGLQDKNALQYFKEFICLSNNFKDFSYENLKPIVAGIIDRHGINIADLNIVTISEKDSTECAKLREYFGVVGDKPNDLARFRDKIAMKNHLYQSSKCRNYLPKYCFFKVDEYKQNKDAVLTRIMQEVGLPIFAKPTNESSCRGTKLIMSYDELKAFTDELTVDYDFEEYITGDLYHCDSVIINGKIVAQFAGRYMYPLFKALSGKPVAGIGVCAEDAEYPQITKFNQDILNGMNITENAVTHLEFYITPNNECKFIEIAKRPPGPLIPEMHEKMFGINLFQVGWEIQCGFENLNLADKAQYAAWYFIPENKGIVEEILPLKELKSHHQITWFIKPGTKIDKTIDSDGCRTGEIMLWNQDYHQLKSEFYGLEDREFYTVKSLTATTSVENASSQRFDNSKDTYVILRDGNLIEDWRQYRAELNANIVIICNKKIYMKIIEADMTAYFDLVIATDDFSESAIDEIVQEHGLAALSPRVHFITSNEFNVVVAGKLNDKYAASSEPWRHKNVLAYVDKDIMKRCLVEKGVRCPKYLRTSRMHHGSFKSLQMDLNHFAYPLFAKPVAGSGSFGIKKIHNENELEQWYEKLDNDEYEVDEFIEGKLYHCDSVIHNGKLLKTFISRYCYPCAEFLNQKPNGSLVLQENTEEFTKLASYVESAIAALPNLGNVVTHMEVFDTGRELVFLEVGARPGGGGIIKMYKHTYGLTTTDLHFRALMNLTMPDINNLPVSSYAAWLNFPTKSGVVQSLLDFNALGLSSKLTVNWNIKEGDKLTAANELGCIACEIFLTNDDYNALQRDFATLAGSVVFQTHPDLVGENDLQTAKVEVIDEYQNDLCCAKYNNDLLCIEFKKLPNSHHIKISQRTEENALRKIFSQLTSLFPDQIIMFDGKTILMRPTAELLGYVSQRYQTTYHSVSLSSKQSDDELKIIHVHADAVKMRRIKQALSVINYKLNGIFNIESLVSNVITVTVLSHDNEMIKAMKSFISSFMSVQSMAQEVSSAWDRVMMLTSKESKAGFTQYEQHRVQVLKEKFSLFRSQHEHAQKASLVSNLRVNNLIFNNFFKEKDNARKLVKFNTGEPAFMPFFSEAASFSEAIACKDEKTYAKYSSRIPSEAMIKLANQFLFEEQLISAGATIESDQLIFANGSVQLFYLALSSYLEPGDIVLMSSPTYGIFLPVIYDLKCDVGIIDHDKDGKIKPHMLSAAITKYNQSLVLKYLSDHYYAHLNHLNQFLQPDERSLLGIAEKFNVTCDNLPQAILQLNEYIHAKIQAGILDESCLFPRLPAVKAFFHMNPHNPTGVLYSQSEINQFAKVLASHPRVMVIDDLVHNNIRTHDKDLGVFEKCPEKLPCLLSLFSPSKAYCQANIRAGMAYGSRSIIQKMHEKLSDTTTSISIPAHNALVNLFKSKVNDRRNYLQHNDEAYTQRYALMKLLITGFNNPEFSHLERFSVTKLIYSHYLQHNPQYARYLTARLLAGVPYITISIDPQGGLFFVADISKIIGLHYASYPIVSSMAFRNILRHLYNVEVLPGENSGNYSGYTLRMNCSRDIESIISGFERIVSFLTLLRMSDNKLPEEVKCYFEKVHELENNGLVYSIMESLIKVKDSVDEVFKENDLAKVAVLLSNKHDSLSSKHLDTNDLLDFENDQRLRFYETSGSAFI